MSPLLLAFAASAPMAAAPADPCAAANTTIEINACLASQAQAVEADLNRYYSAAVKRLRSEKGSAETKVLPALVRAERSWLAYRDAECGAIETYWEEGSIRTSMALTCRISLTRLRIFSIWRDWLTYADSTPPDLPRPDLKLVLSEH